VQLALLWIEGTPCLQGLKQNLLQSESRNHAGCYVRGRLDSCEPGGKSAIRPEQLRCFDKRHREIGSHLADTWQHTFSGCIGADDRFEFHGTRHGTATVRKRIKEGHIADRRVFSARTLPRLSRGLRPHFDGTGDGIEGCFWMILDAFLCHQCL
jgi:hypothetical protein